MTERERKMKASVDQFCHAVGNSMQPEKLLEIADSLKKADEAIKIRDRIIIAMLVSGLEAGCIDPADENIKAIKELVRFKESDFPVLTKPYDGKPLFEKS